MAKRKVAALEKVDADLVNLQHKIRADPKSYLQEFHDQWLAYDAQKAIFLSAPQTAPAKEVKQFHDLVDLIAHVADLYPDLTSPQFPEDLKAIIAQHHAILAPDLREKVVGSLVLLRRKDVISSTELLTSLFPILVTTPSKTLRAFIYTKIISDLRDSNSKATNHPLNKTIIAVLRNLVTSDRTSAKGVWAVKITRELWKRQVSGWTDARPVDVMKEACLAENEKTAIGGVRFFLGGDKDREELEDDSSDDEAVDIKQVKHVTGINKKSKARARALEKAVSKVKRQEKKKNAPQITGNFSALHLLHDPQGFASELFEKHLQRKNKMALENRLLVLSLVTRLVGMHKLTLISLYPWFSRFLTPKQTNVTSVLASLAQGTHNHVPPDSLEPLILKIANEFVSEGCASEVAAAGLNAIREICMRQPLAMTETLLGDLIQYQKSKDKGVVMAAKGLQSLYREVHPELLQKKYRGKNATMGLRSGEIKKMRFGEEEEGGIEGIELLEQYKEEQRKQKRAEQGLDSDGEEKEDDEDDDDGFHSSEWEVDSDAESTDSGGWINVESDSEDEGPVTKRQRTESEAPELVDKNPPKSGGVSKLATSSILTPADLAKLAELRRQAKVEKEMGTSAKRKRELIAKHIEEGLTAEDIELPATLGKKSTKEERVARAKEGKPDRDEHKSTQAIRKSKKEADGKSSTNKEKARKKNFMMTLGKARAKNKRSLVETRKTLRQHVARSKSGGRRRNGVGK